MTSALAVTSIAWIPRGSSRQKPVRFEMTAEDANILTQKAKAAKAREDEEEELDGDIVGDIDFNEDEDVVDEEDGEASNANENMNADDTELPPEFDMDNYDNEGEVNLLEALDNDDDDEDMDEDDDIDNVANLIPPDSSALNEPMDDEDEEDDEILATDTILAVAMTEDDVSHVEIQVLTSEGSLYTHHDIMLPDFPLSMAWMDCPPYLNENGTQTGLGSYLAVGTFSPAIEIWNLDVLDPIEPSAILGGEDESKSKRKNKQKPAYLPGSHTDAVLSLSWNTTYRQALASGSADTTVKVWDVTTQQCSFTLDHHKDKVQTVLWHPHEAHLLTSASYDKRVCLIDMRNPKYQCATMAMLNSDIESLTYDPFAPHHLYGATEDGRVFIIDLRKFVMNSSQSATLNQKDFLLSFQAHDKTVSSLSFSAGIPGLLATSSLDKTVKVWDTASLQADYSDSPPTCVAYKNMNVGRLFTAKFSGDDPFLYATGGDKGMLAVWEADEMDTIRTHFENRKLPIVSQYLQQEVIEGNETALDRQRRISHEQLSGLVVPAHALSEKMRQDAIIAEFEADQENEKKNKKTNKKKDSGNAVSVSDLSGGDKKQKKKGGNK